MKIPGKLRRFLRIFIWGYLIGAFIFTCYAIITDWPNSKQKDTNIAQNTSIADQTEAQSTQTDASVTLETDAPDVPDETAADSEMSAEHESAVDTQAIPEETAPAAASEHFGVPYRVSFIGDAFHYDEGLASVVLETGEVCVIDETGKPLVCVAGTRYAEREENELSYPAIMNNGCFYFRFFHENGTDRVLLFSHDGRPLADKIFGETTGCDGVKCFFGADGFYWVTMEGGFSEVSYTLHCLDANGTETTQAVSSPEQAVSLIPNADEYVEDPAAEVANRIAQNLGVSYLGWVKLADGRLLLNAEGADGRPYYGFASADGVMQGEMKALDADVAHICGTNLLLVRFDPASPDQAGSISLFDSATETITELPWYGFVDGTESRRALRPFAEAGSTLESGQPRRTNFIRPDGSMLFEKDEYGNAVLYVPTSVPRY